MRKTSSFILITLLAGCSESAKPVYVSPLEFQSYNCKQIAKDMSHTSSQIEQLSARNQTGDLANTALIAYGISQGYGFYDDGAEDPQLAYQKAKYNALHQASIQKNCD